MKRRLMVVGPTRSGKTTLINAVAEENRLIKPTMDVIYGKRTIEIPGAYIENTWMYQSIISVAQNGASSILLLVDSTFCRDIYPPNFAKVFTMPVIGVLTKTDCTTKYTQRGVAQLQRAGVERIVRVSMFDPASMQDLKTYLF